MSRELSHDEILGKPQPRITIVGLLAFHLEHARNNPQLGIMAVQQQIRDLRAIAEKRFYPKKKSDATPTT